MHVLVNVKHKEMIYLTEVLKKGGESREVSLTPLIFLAVDMMKRVVFRVMKEVIC